MRALNIALFLILCCASLRAQLVFTAQDLVSRSGEFYTAYARSSDFDVSAFLGAKGGPHRWDFSQPRTNSEDIHRYDIVAVADGGHGADFSAAAYAERITRQSTGVKSWAYYRLVPGQGRAYYGFFDPVSNSANPLKVFDTPTIDLPETIRFGQKWNRGVDFQDVLDAGLFQASVAIHFTSEALVDAYGTMVLPGLGEAPALRVNELNAYESSELTLGLPLGTTYVRNYYWLVKGVGKAVHILSKADTKSVPENFKTASTVLRVFESSELKRQRTVANLRAVLQGDAVVLAWSKESATGRYRVETAEELATPPAWKLLQETQDASLVAPLVAGQAKRFYRVLVVD